MKKYPISIAVIVAALAMAWAVFGQQAERPGGAGPAGGRGAFMMPEEQLKVLESIEQQVAKLKEAVKTSAFPAGRSFQDLSDEEKTKMKEQMTKARQERQAAIKTILTQLARLQGRPQPAEGVEYIIVSTADLKAVQELATKEKATQTSERISAMLQPPRGFGGRRSQEGQPGQPGQPGERGTRQKPAEKPGAGNP